MAYEFFVHFEIFRVIFTFLIGPYISFIINRKNIKFQVIKENLRQFVSRMKTA